MSTPKLQVGRALRVIPSDNAVIPFPGAVMATGTNTSTGASQLIMATATFVTNNIKAGDVVYNTTDSTAATVTSVVSETTLNLNANIFTATAKAFVVYQASAQNGISNQPCVLFVGGAGNLNVVTAGGDTVLFNGLAAGQFLPVHVVQVLSSSTTATLINALW